MECAVMGKVHPRVGLAGRSICETTTRRSVLLPSRERKHHACFSVPDLQSRKKGTRRSATASILEYDVVIVGAGIIGTTTAHHILTNTQMSVALIDARESCAGATGAGLIRLCNPVGSIGFAYPTGQGYIWMSHRKPGTPGWALAKRSKRLWENFAMEVETTGVDPLHAMGWRNTGSLLVSSTDDQVQGIKDWVQDLKGDVAAEYLTDVEATNLEPSLASGCVTGAAYFPEDSQLDARLTMNVLQQRVRMFSAGGRYKEFFNNPVQQFIRTPAGGCLIGVETREGKVFSRTAVVLATGAWSSALMDKATAEWGLSLVPPIKPRKGHLVVVEGAHNIELRHGIMEMDYLNLYDNGSKKSESTGSSASLELAMTATLDQNGNLLLGSSREFAGFNVDIQHEVVEKIMIRAMKFLPGISYVLQRALQDGKVRTGLRPFIADGRPIIGPLDDVPGLIFATGHEGNGLCLALATAEMVTSMVQEAVCIVDPSPFLPAGRLGAAEKSMAY